MNRFLLIFLVLVDAVIVYGSKESEYSSKKKKITPKKMRRNHRH